MSKKLASKPDISRPLHPFRRAVLRGLGVVLPPLLTIVIFVWVGNTVAVYLLDPLENLAERGIALSIQDIQNPDNLNVAGNTGTLKSDSDKVYHRTVEGRFVPMDIYETVKRVDGGDVPPNAKDIYRRYVRVSYLQRRYVIPVFLTCFVLLLYLLGRFLAAGVGKFFWGSFEGGIHRLPIVRNVYTSVKQITDFLFNEREVEYTRVVAVEYPRKGIWSLGMVTGESMLDIRSAANEPVLSVLVPTSPMPFTGFTVTVKKSETVDLNITIDQAFQFIVSCGVVVPPDQLSSIADRMAVDEADAKGEVAGEASASSDSQTRKLESPSQGAE